MKKKILYVSANGYLGGAEKFVLTACAAHKNSPHLEPCILFFKNGEAVELAKQLNIPFHVLKSSFKLKKLRSFLKALKEIRNFVKKQNFQIIHNTMSYSHIVMSLALIRLPVKSVWFQHGPVGGILDKLASVFSSDLLIFNSAYLQQHHHQTTPLKRSKREMILKLGINPGKGRAKPIFSDDVIKLGTSGRICEWKAFHHIIQALDEMAGEQKLRSFTFSLAGSAKNDKDKLYFEKLKKQVEGSTIKDKIILAGYREDITTFYNELDVFIHASMIPEPFGLVVAEAMAQECLVIGSNAGGVTDILIGNKTGLTFDTVSPDSIHELKKILLPILGENKNPDVERYREISKKGRSLIHQRYSVNSMVNQLEVQYLSL